MGNGKCNSNRASSKSNSARNKRSGKSKYTDGRKRGNKRMDEDTRDVRNYESTGSNDPSWYAVNPSLLRDAASIPFSWSTGTTTNLVDQFPIVNGGVQFADELNVPGLACLRIAPSVGVATDPNSPLNIASTAMYSFVRHANSGHSNYDSPDLTLYVFAMAQVYSYINYLMRAYGTATLYSQTNRYLPSALINAMDIDFDDLRNHLADFRYGVNLLIAKAASLAVPASMTIFRRYAFMYQYIYTEGTSIKDQMYMYSPASFYHFEYDHDMAGMLKLIPFHVEGKKYTVNELLAYGNKLLDPILSSEDMNIMSGDILKAYGGDIIKLGTLPEYFPIVPVFNIGVLEQMRNATPVGSKFSADIKQSADKGYLVSTPQVHASNLEYTKDSITLRLLGEKHVLSTTTDAVGPELVMENTRLMVSVKDVNDSGAEGVATIICGSDVCTQVDYYLQTSEALNVTSNYYYKSYFADPSKWSDNYAEAVEKLVDYNREIVTTSRFKFTPFWHPTVNIVSIATGSGILDMYLAGDIDNYAVLDHTDLENLHETALMSLLSVPSIAKV